jgi:hypothetical protein
MFIVFVYDVFQAKKMYHKGDPITEGETGGSVNRHILARARARLSARETFMEFCRRESFMTYKANIGKIYQSCFSLFFFVFST